MPTYEYKCTQCNYTFEIFQPMSAEPLKECPKCKGPIKRLIGTGAGPIFKGSGFYHTDYKNKPTNSGSTKKEEKKDSKSSDKGSKKSNDE
jgi:putative FmdB family regulatory protein